MRFGALDGWRGVCAVLIAVMHLNAVGWISGLPVITYSYLFVDFFFVLSGFVIAHAYVDRIQNPQSLLSFLIRRFGRVYPLHVFVLAILVMIEVVRLAASLSGSPMDPPAFSHGTSLGKLATNLVLAHSLGVHNAGSWNYPSWSISAEFYTYIVFGVLLVGTHSFRAWLRNHILMLSMILAAAILIANSCTAMFTTFELGLYRCIFGFMSGALTYRAYRASLAARPEAPLDELQLRLQRLISDKVVAAVLEILTVLTVVLFIGLAKYGRMSFGAPFVFSAAVFVFAHEAGPVSTVLKSRPFALIGMLSYSIYMIHDVIAIDVIHRGFSAIERFTHLTLHRVVVSPIGETTVMIDLHDRFAGDLLMLAYLAVVICLARLTHRWIEAPWQATFNRLAERVTVRSPEPERQTL